MSTSSPSSTNLPKRVLSLSLFSSSNQVKMSNLLGFNTPISTSTNNPSKLNTTISFFNGELPPTILTIPIMSSSSLIFSSPYLFFTSRPPKFTKQMFSRKVGCVQVEEQAAEMEIAEGYTMTKFCDKIIDLFLNEKPRVKDWRKYLVFREDWKKYRDKFYNRCHTLAISQADSVMKQKLVSLGRKVKRIDDEMERHTELLKEIEGSPLEINAIVSKRRKDFTEEFFRHLTLLSETYDGLEDRDAVARLGARCLAAVGAYDNTIEIVDTMDSAQAKFDDILNSPSVEEACEKIYSLAKAKELDSSLILLINSAWATAKESTTMKNEVKDIMYRLYRATKISLKSIEPKEIKLLKYLLNITDPEERFSALATAFSPGDDHEARDSKAVYTTPKELHKWIKIMLDAHHLHKEDTEIREAKQMTPPMVIQRLFILKETIEEEYFEQNVNKENKTENSEELL